MNTIRTIVLATLVTLGSTSVARADDSKQTAATGQRVPAFVLSIPGDWVPRADLEKAHRPDADLDILYDRTKGSVLYVQRRSSLLDIDPASIGTFLADMRRNESFWGEHPHPQFARLLANSYFGFPDRYNELSAASKKGPLYVWELPEIEGDAHLFYLSQLTPRIGVVKSQESINIGEEYARLKMTRAEKVDLEKGAALVIELETETPAVAKANGRFKMPESIKGQRLRYGLVIYGPEGLDRRTSYTMRVLYAAPVNTEVTHEVVLSALSQSFLKTHRR